MSRADAERRIDAFERSRGSEMLQLASHAALPVVLDAPLLHLLRVNYFLDPPVTLPYTAEAQLLLSPLCAEIDDGLYVIAPDERDVLLRKLVTDYGGARLRDVARLLWEYCERGTPWIARPGLAEAQQLTALNFIEPQRAQAWLERAETEGARGGAIADQRWFVAMRKDLAGRAAAVDEAEANPMTPAGSLPALVELRDALRELYGNPSAARRVARDANIALPTATVTGPASQPWQQLVEAASAAGRIPALLATVAKDYPNNPAVTRTIQAYWIRLSPALRVENGRFETPPPEWQILEQHREAIERSIRSLCLFAQEGHLSTTSGLGFLIGERTILTHKSMVTLTPGDQGPAQDAWLAFADRHSTWPEFLRGDRISSAFLSAGFHPVNIEWVEIDEPTGACAIRFAVDPVVAAEFPPPLTLITKPPSDLLGRKVYVMGYPSVTDKRTDPALSTRILGDVKECLRVQPGEITGEITGEEYTRAKGGITHNCFTLGGNGGAPLIDLESGAVLGLHYAAWYEPGPSGLKSGRVIPMWRLADRPVLSGIFEEPRVKQPSTAGPDRLQQAAERICRIRGSDRRGASGFLVGRDLVLTCFHVISDYVENDQLSGVTFHFAARSGETTDTVIPLASNGLVAYSPPSEGTETLATPGGLDYALLRLVEPLGEQRGWLGISANLASPSPGSPIQLLDRERRLVGGIVQGDNSSGTRLSFSLQEDPEGLSGAPCFDGDLNVIAMLESLYFSPQLERYQGIAIAAIVRDLAAKGVEGFASAGDVERARETPQTRLSPRNIRELSEILSDTLDFDELEQIIWVSTGAGLFEQDVPRGLPLGQTIVSLLEELERRGTTQLFLREVYAARPDRQDVRAAISERYPEAVVETLDAGVAVAEETNGRIQAQPPKTPAVAFVQAAELPPSPKAEVASEQVAAFDFDTNKDQAVVVGSDIVSFVKGVTEERRRDITNSLLLAQLVANNKVPRDSDVLAWYDAYFDALTKIGWVVQAKRFSTYKEAGDTFTAHEAIVSVATTLLGPGAPALALIKTTLNTLQSLDTNSPGITLFNQESQQASSARFQVTLAEQEEAGQFVVTLMAFALSASAKVTQILLFKFRSSEVELKHSSGKVTINTAVLDAIRKPVEEKLGPIATAFVKAVPDL